MLFFTISYVNMQPLDFNPFSLYFVHSIYIAPALFTERSEMDVTPETRSINR